MTSRQFLIFILLLIPWPPSNVIKILCSRDNSRLVRKIVRSKWTPILDKHHVKLPLECPLHPLRDVFAPRQEAKQRDRPTQWTCRICGKSFYQEKYLDLHFETRHKHIINEAEDAVCLADFCDIMRCEVFQTEDASSLKFGDQHIVTDIEVWGDSLGQNSALAKANAAYLSLIPRTSTLSATRAAKVQNRQLLQEKPSPTQKQTPADAGVSASAEDGSAVKPKSAGEKLLMKLKELSQTHLKRAEVDAENTAEESRQNETDDAEHSGDGECSGQLDAGQILDASNSQAKTRANCNPEELSKLKARCEYLLRSCIGGLLLSMTDQAFKEMEEEMNKAVCWYLTCDRYWEDGPLEPRAFPWGLIVILIFVLSTGICFCYYIIWILFDSEETTINANHYAGVGAGGSIYMPAPHLYHHDYATQQELQLDAGGIPGLTIDPQQHQHQHQQQQQQQQYYYQHQHQQQQLQHQLQQQQQQQLQQARDLYPESVQYHRHSPRHYIADQRPPAQGAGQCTPTSSSAAGVRQVGGSSSNANTPLHRHSTSLAYPQDILDRRDYTSNSGRPMATSVVSSNVSNAGAGGAGAGGGGGSGGAGGAGGGGGAGGAGVHYNTHPRPLDTRHRHVGASQQSLRASSSTHEILQSEVGGHNEHYIYVTYPPDLKNRYFDKYE